MTEPAAGDDLTLADIVREFLWEAWQGNGRYYARHGGRPRTHSYTVTATTLPALRREILTSDERNFVERAAAAIFSSITEFVVGSAVIAAQRVLADRARFELDASVVAAWEAINDRPARDVPGLRRLMNRPLPFEPVRRPPSAPPGCR